ncbi:MAG: S8 family peptidase [Acidobacteriaceae bacterium]|nr:S8 family peptidase [Acidobacteriaceae bacterium]
MKKIVSFLLAAAIACSAGTPKNKISSDLASAGKTSAAQVQVVVQWNISIGTATTQKISALGGTVISEFPAVRSGVYNVPPSALDALSADGDVKYVSVDRKIHKKAASVGITSATINAQYAWAAGYSGSGIGVAVLDSGINEDDNLGVSVHKPVYTEDFTVSISTQPDGKPGPKPDSYGLDWYGHGQHIAGIIASNGKESNCGNCTQTFVGIAPGANLIDLKVLDTNGEGSDSYVIAAIDRAIALKSTYNIRVMNLSLGRPVYESYTQDPLCQAVEAAWKAGIVVVVSAGNDGRDNSFGNDGYGTINAPGNDPYVLTVGAMRSMGTATRSDDLIASYSSKGPTAVDHIVKPDIVAPGNQIISLLAKNGTLPLSNPQNVAALAAYQSNPPKLDNIPVQPNYNRDSTAKPPDVKVGGGRSNKYYILNGTSMAAGVVSGAVADLLQANPALTPDQVKMLLMQTASKTFPTVSTVVDSTTGQIYTSYYDIFTVGAGYMDLKAALALVNQVPTGLTAISPTATYDSTSGDVELSFDSSSVFSNRAMWGADTTSANRAMWGASGVWSNSVLSGSRAMWGASSVWGASSSTDANRAMWGASTDSSNRAMWGASAIWTNRALWGASSMTASQSVMIDGEQ